MLHSYRVKLDRIKNKKAELLSSIDACTSGIEEQKLACADICDAIDVMNAVSALSKAQVIGTIESLCTKALQSVLGTSYKFVVETGMSRGRTDVEFWVEEDGERFSVKDDESGGERDVISFALRIIVWALSESKLSSTIVLDEPGKHISADKIPLFSMLIKELSEMLGIQFIIVSHVPEIAEAGDTWYHVEKVNGYSEAIKRK